MFQEKKICVTIVLSIEYIKGLILDIGARIIQIREKLGFTQYSLAKVAKVAQPSLLDIERGKTTPNVKTLEKLCSALGITLAEFFAEDDKQVDPMERQLLVAYRQLGDCQKSSLVTVADAMAVEYKRYKAKREEIRGPEEG